MLIFILKNIFSQNLIFSATAEANNPFLADATYGATGAAMGQDQGQYYGRGYSQAQSGYSSSGLGY